MARPYIRNTHADIRETVALCHDRLGKALTTRVNAAPNLGDTIYERHGLELAADDAHTAADWVRRMGDYTESAGIGSVERWAPDLLPWLDSVIEVTVHANFYFRRPKAKRGPEEAARLLAEARALLAEAPQ